MEKKTKTGGGTGTSEEMVFVFSHLPLRPLKYPKPYLSILVKTETGEVYGGGLNVAKGSTELNNYIKVGAVDGKVKKIAVGPEHCAALTHDGRLMLWEHKNFLLVDPAHSIRLRRYKSGESCLSCRDGCTGMYGISYCDGCDMYQPGRKDDDDDDECEPIIISQKERTLLCLDCSEPQNTKPIKTWDQVENKSMNVTVAFCALCLQFFNDDNYHQLMNINNPVRTILRKSDERIKDVAFFGSLIILIFESNNLYIRNPHLIDENKMTCFRTNENSSGEMVAVYGGVMQWFVKYNDGSLFKCSDICHIKETCVLRDMKLPANVEKVCVGVLNTAVLLSDGSVWFIAPDCTTYRLVHESGLDVFTDIAVIGNSDVYLVQAPTGTTSEGAVMNISSYSERYNVIVEFYESALNIVLKKMVPPTPHTNDSSNIPARAVAIKPLPLPSPNMAQLYGKSHLADMTIKLADEELPAHSVVLFATSAHFQKTFNADNSPPNVFDVSHYNPQAYKYLLQYFYQIQPDDLDAEGFTHLRQIAASYGETQLADAATAKIKSLLCEDNAERICILSKRYDFQDLAIESERIMRSQPSMEKPLKTAMKDLATSEETVSWHLLTVSVAPAGKVKK